MKMSMCACKDSEPAVEVETGEGDVLVEDDGSESSYTSAAEETTIDDAAAHGPNISELRARRQQLVKQVAEQVQFTLA